MRVSLKTISCIAVAAAAGVLHADTVLRSKTLADLTKASSSSSFTRNNCDFISLSTDSTGGPVATLRFHGTYASFGQNFSSAQDWSPYNMVQAVVTNKESHGVQFKFVVQLKSDINSYSGAYTGAFDLDANQTRRFIFTLNPDSAKPFGMEYLRPVLTADYNEVIAGSTFRNLQTVYHWRISNQDSTTTTLAVSQVKLIRQNLVFDGIADTYGQYTDRDWPDKIHASTDFAVRKATELTDLTANPGTGETNGSKVLKSTNTSGTWKVIKDPSGMTYLQHPNGRYFWSVGASGIAQGPSTPVEGRTNLFQSLPSQTGTDASAYMMRPTPDGNLLSFSFNVKNLISKYGSNYSASWESIVRQRLASWGVNTIGIQSNTDFLDGTIPFTVIDDTNDFGTRLKPPHILWRSLPDPYATNFQTWMTSKFKTDLANCVGNQDFMGVFIDNEISWGNTDTLTDNFNVPRGVLNAPSTQPSKTAFMNQLESKYKNSISALNSAWGSKYSSWSSFLSTQWLPTTYSSGMQSDFKTFLTSYATTYYSKVSGALDSAGLKSLYLGSRFDDYTPEVISAASKYVDVLSFNVYRTVDNFDWSYMNSLPKPVLISELGYGTKAWGTFGGPATMFSVQDRSNCLQAFLQKAITESNFVGVHWYSYIDQPITGRWSDYENSGMGFVDVADNPYMPTVQVLRAFTKAMYSVRG